MKETPSFMNWGFEPQDEELFLYTVSYLETEVFPSEINTTINVLTKEELLNSFGNPNYERKDGMISSYYYYNYDKLLRTVQTHLEILENQEVQEVYTKIEEVFKNLSKWVEEEKYINGEMGYNEERAEDYFQAHFITTKNFIHFSISESFESWNLQDGALTVVISRLNL